MVSSVTSKRSGPMERRAGLTVPGPWNVDKESELEARMLLWPFEKGKLSLCKDR